MKLLYLKKQIKRNIKDGENQARQRLEDDFPLAKKEKLMEDSNF